MELASAGALVFWLGLSFPAIGEDRQDKPVTLAAELQALSREFQGTAHGLFEAKTDEERGKVAEEGNKFPPRFLALGEKDPDSEAGRDALVQVIVVELWLENNTLHAGWGKRSPGVRAIELLLSHQIRSDRLDDACRRVAYGFRRECETFLRTVLEKSPHREVQAHACLRLAQFLNSRQQRLDVVLERPDGARRYEEIFGKDYIDELKRQDRAGAAKEVEALFERAAEKYGDVKLPFSGTVGEKAGSELDEIRRLSVGREVPDIEGQDQDGTRFKLSDYRGRVVLLYFWSEY
jgi:hypothetical protein